MAQTLLVSRAIRLLLWLAPLVVCVAIYRLGLATWFVQDDFAGLLIARKTNTWGEALAWLTQTQAQGVLRPLPDCYYWIGLFHLYGFNAVPYRLVVFGTQLGSLVFLNAIVRRLTGSAGLGFLAAMVWVLNTGIIVGMAWSSAYSQVLCAFFCLAGFWCFVRHTETGRWGFYAGQWLALVLGLGTLEITLAYPAVVVAYCWLVAPRHLWRAVMLAFTGVYAVASLLLVPRSASGPYMFHWDLSMAAGLWHYWTGVLGVRPLGLMLGWRAEATLAVSVVLTVALGWAIYVAPRARQRIALVGLGWFVFTLGPVLPLRDQRMDYYLTVPSIGLAICVAAAIGALLEERETRRTAAVWLMLYAGCSLPVIDNGMRYWYERSQNARRLLEGTLAARQAHPDKALVLSGVGDALFYAAIYDRGLDVVGLEHVYLAPGSGVLQRPGFRSPATFELPAVAMAQALRDGEARVFATSAAGTLRDSTGIYSVGDSAARLSWVNAGEPFMAAALGEGWWAASGGSRWMSRRAEVRLAAPRPGQRLHLRAIYPGAGKAEPERLTITANGVVLATVTINQQSTDHTVDLPESLTRAAGLDLVLDADHTFRIGTDLRDLAVAFGVIELI